MEMGLGSSRIGVGLPQVALRMDRDVGGLANGKASR